MSAGPVCLLPEHGKPESRVSLRGEELMSTESSCGAQQGSLVAKPRDPGGSVVKNLPANAGDRGSVPGSARSPGEGNGNPLQYSCLENSMDRGTLWAVVHWIAKS